MLSGGSRSGCKLAFFRPFGSGCTRTEAGGAEGGGTTDDEPVFNVLVRWCGRPTSTDRFLGVSMGRSELVRDVGKNVGIGRDGPSASEYPDCDDLKDAEKKGG